MMALARRLYDAGSPWVWVGEQGMSCKHITTPSEQAAYLDGGRWFDKDTHAWRCPWCEDWDAAVLTAAAIRGRCSRPSMRWYTPPENQGQIVTVSYAWGVDEDEGLYRRSFDASGHTTVTRRLDPWDFSEEQAAEVATWDPWNSNPPVWLSDLLDQAPMWSEPTDL